MVKPELLKKLANLAGRLDSIGEYKQAEELDYIIRKLAMSRMEAAQILGVSDNASQQDIEKAWKQKAFESHPDRGGSLEDMKNINIARDILLNKREDDFESPNYESSPTEEEVRAEQYREYLNNNVFNSQEWQDLFKHIPKLKYHVGRMLHDPFAFLYDKPWKEGHVYKKLAEYALMLVVDSSMGPLRIITTLDKGVFDAFPQLKTYKSIQEAALEIFKNSPEEFVSLELANIWPDVAYKYVVETYTDEADNPGFFGYNLYKIPEYSHLEDKAAEAFMAKAPEHFFYDTDEGKVLRERHADKLPDAAKWLFEKDPALFTALYAEFGFEALRNQADTLDDGPEYYVIKDMPHRFFESDWVARTLREHYSDNLIEAAIEFSRQNYEYFKQIMPNFPKIYEQFPEKGANVDTYAQLKRLDKLAYHLDLQGLYNEAAKIEEVMKLLAQRVGLEKEAKKKKKSKKPPKKWWDKMVKEIKKNSPKYSEERVNKTIGDIWFNNLTEKKRKEIRGRYE
jgi:hypothetical protein